MDDGKGYLTWLPKHENDEQIQIVAQLDQLYAYMLMITPSLPEPYQSIWKKDMKKIADILITQFYSEKYQFFWGTEYVFNNGSYPSEKKNYRLYINNIRSRMAWNASIFIKQSNQKENQSCIISPR